MRPRLRLLAAALLAAAVAWPRDAREPPLLRGELRRASGKAPAWIVDAVCLRAPDLAPDCETVARALYRESTAAKIDPMLVLAMIEVESRWDPRAVSRRGARGLLQVLRPVAAAEARRSRRPALDLHDPLDALHAGVRYLARLVRAFGDGDLALIAYNAGPNRLRRHLAAGALPARFLAYPRRVRAEAARLRERFARGGDPPPRAPEYLTLLEP